MNGIDEKIKEIKAQIPAISGKRKLDILTSTCFLDADSRLEMISRRIVEKEKLPLILWNVSPTINFSILHAIYLIKLKQCIDLGFDCVIIMYDKSVEKALHIPLVERSFVQENVINCIRTFIKAGLKEDKTEFITESDLWSFIKFEDFAETVTSLSHLCKVDSRLAEKEEAASIIMDNLCEIYYENLINSDVLLVGKKDEQEIWGILKNKILINSKLFPNYVPPLVLSFPTLKGIDGKDLTTSSDENSLSIRHTREDLKSRIERSPLEFMEMLFAFFIIPWKKKLIINDKELYNWEELYKCMSISDIKILAIDYIDQYFSLIRGG